MVGAFGGFGALIGVVVGIWVVGCSGGDSSGGAAAGDEIGEGAGGCDAGHSHCAGRVVPAG